MRQIGVETDDPLKRIQEEINEVARRERELREGSQYANQDDCLSSSNSDDSGLSLSPSPVHSPSVSNLKVKLQAHSKRNTTDYTIPLSKVLTRARSTPQLFNVSPARKFNVNPNQKGLMQKFIASRGKLINTSLNNQNHIKSDKNMMSPIERPQIFIPPTAISTSPAIERDTNGRPIRRGYVPVEEKIQKELRDLKSREFELKRIRKKTRNMSQSDLLDMSFDNSISSDDSGEVSDDGDDSEENSYPHTRKLRSTKSIGELCDALTNSSLSPRETPSPQFESRTKTGGLRPAVSLALLCDLDPHETPSSHKLIAQWESLIQQKQQR